MCNRVQNPPNFFGAERWSGSRKNKWSGGAEISENAECTFSSTLKIHLIKIFVIEQTILVRRGRNLHPHQIWQASSSSPVARESKVQLGDPRFSSFSSVLLGSLYP